MHNSSGIYESLNKERTNMKIKVFATFKRSRLITFKAGIITSYSYSKEVSTLNNIKELCWEKLKYESQLNKKMNIFECKDLLQLTVNYLSTFSCGDMPLFQSPAREDSIKLIRN